MAKKGRENYGSKQEMKGIQLLEGYSMNQGEIDAVIEGIDRIAGSGTEQEIALFLGEFCKCDGDGDSSLSPLIIEYTGRYLPKLLMRLFGDGGLDTEDFSALLNPMELDGKRDFVRMFLSGDDVRKKIVVYMQEIRLLRKFTPKVGEKPRLLSGVPEEFSTFFSKPILDEVEKLRVQVKKSLKLK